eukprot:TRINITY_DN3677_c0_g1_i2.p1 TRINITY_DN3677_c0_g1~~TRINITY_DN3677_c0_g1_i2.p1  ORF type:complete len:514 (+),score=92.33 TRINITY_DN3677_c0_g1_i2:79-1620(+)
MRAASVIVVVVLILTLSIYSHTTTVRKSKRLPPSGFDVHPVIKLIPGIPHNTTLRVDANDGLLRLFEFIKNIEGMNVTSINSSLDAIPYRERLVRRSLKFPLEGDLPFLKLPPVPPAPTGIAAIKLARKLGYPDKWRARQRPEFFILGPPKSGTTFMEACFKWSMFGNSSKRTYPMASERWPVTRLEGGEPDYSTSPLLEPFRLWNRTGYRRFDPPKEWWVYPEMGRYPTEFRGFVNTQRFPPVEEPSKNWFVIDSTPDSIMIPKAAQALALDLEGAPFEPSFLVMHRDVVNRAYSHFLLFTSLRVMWGWKEETMEVFTDRLDQQHAVLESIPICRKMLYQPFEVIQSLDDTYNALRWCMYDPKIRNQVMYLPFGFTALGLRYWISKFKPENFRFLKFSTMKVIGKDPKKLFDFYEDIFPGIKRNLPRCEKADQWNSGNCTGWQLHSQAELMCGPDSPALASQAWTRRKDLNFTKGKPENLEKYQKIAENWDKAFDALVSEYNLSWYQPRPVG